MAAKDFEQLRREVLNQQKNMEKIETGDYAVETVKTNPGFFDHAESILYDMNSQADEIITVLDSILLRLFGGSEPHEDDGAQGPHPTGKVYDCKSKLLDLQRKQNRIINMIKEIGSCL